VTHYGIGEADIDVAVAAVADALRATAANDASRRPAHAGSGS
jgi:hypothetical protein